MRARPPGHIGLGQGDGHVADAEQQDGELVTDMSMALLVVSLWTLP